LRKELILEVATKKFAEKGYNCSLSEIAKESGIRKQTLYNYFESKDALLLEIIGIETTNYFESKKSEFLTFKDFNSEERLHRMFLSIIEYFSNREKFMFWRWMVLIDSESLKKSFRESTKAPEKRFVETIYTVFSSGIESKEIKDLPILPLINTYYALIHGVLESILLIEDEAAASIYVNNVWTIFWQGIKY